MSNPVEKPLAGSLSILSAGACTPAGLTLNANVASFRAGLNNFARSAYFRDQRSGANFTLSCLDSIRDTTAAQRMRFSALKAAGEACGSLAVASHLNAGLLLAAPEDRPGFSSQLARELAQAIVAQVPLSISKQHCVIQQGGNAGLMLLLRTAHQLLSARDLDVCLLGGADSYIQIEALHWLENSGRLRSPEQPNGLIPGEGAAFLVLSRTDSVSRCGGKAIGELSGFSTTQEPQPWYRRQATLGRGLTDTVRQTFQTATASEADAVYADMNGESWRADEWGYAYLRNASHIASPLRTFHLASSLGETGAASAPLALSIAAAVPKHSQNGGKSLLVWSASGTLPLRGSCLLRKVEA